MKIDYGELKCKNCGVTLDGLDNLNDHEDFCNSFSKYTSVTKEGIKDEL